MKLCTLNGTVIFATSTGLKLGSRGKVVKPLQLLRSLPKGEARRIRKAARKNGRIDIASAK